MKKEEWKLFQRQSLLADWYGRDYAYTEMAVHTPHPVSIDKELDAFLKRAGSSDSVDFGNLCEAWPKIVGEKLALHSSPLRFDNDKLVVSADHPAWQMELRRMKNLLRTRSNNILGREKIREVVFVASSSKS